MGVFVPYFDWGTESCFSFCKHENVKYITAKLIQAHKLVNYVNQSHRILSLIRVSIKPFSLVSLLRGQFKLQINLQRLQVHVQLQEDLQGTGEVWGV